MSAKKLFDLYSSEFKADPFPTYTHMRTAIPVCQHPDSNGNDMWFITRAEEIETVLRDHKTFVKNWRNTRTAAEAAELDELPETAKLLEHHMLNMDGGDHIRVRSLVNKAFTPRMVNQMRDRVQSVADELIANFIDSGQTDLITAYAFPLPIVVIMEMLGIPVADRDKFRIWSHVFIAPASVTEKEGLDANALLMDFIEYLRLLFAERRKAPKHDLISALIAAEEEGDKLTESELYGMVILLIVAGHETTTNLIGNGTLAFIQHPEQLALLQTDPRLIESAVEEIIRYCGPVDRATIRFVAQDTELAGQRLQRGDVVSVVVNSANRDRTKFDDADTFDIRRTDNKHLGFGYGVHYCLGAQLARMEGDIALSTLFARLPNLRLAVPVEDLVWDTVPITRGMKQMPVQWDI